MRRAFLLLAVPLLATAACGGRKTASPAPAAPEVTADTIRFAVDAPQLSSLKTEAPSLEELPPTPFTGRLAWDEDATVRILPPVAGRIVRLVATVGMRVRSGDVLAELSSPDYGQAQADAARAAADLAVAGQTRERTALLVEKGAAPRKDLEAAEADLARARAEARRTEERLRRWTGAVPRTGELPDQIYMLRAPMAGAVVERNANPGQEVRPDAPAPLFVVSDPSRLWVFVDVTERDLGALAAGDRLTIRSPAFPDKPFAGRLTVVGDALDPTTRTVKARGSVDNREGLLKAEMYVDVENAGRAPRRAPVVAARAILSAGEARYCFVQDGATRFRRIPVTVGVERAGRVPVLSGLPDGALVVTDGSLLLATLLPSGSGS
ncbi:MAG: efflux RND transporter periplasmic adaptor subunit [Thermoanaerobaculia bacterium]